VARIELPGIVRLDAAGVDIREDEWWFSAGAPANLLGVDVGVVEGR